MDVAFPSHIWVFESIFCSMMEVFALETAKIALRVIIEIIYVSEGDCFALELNDNREKAEGEVVEDGKVQDDDCGCSKHNGGVIDENGDSSAGGEWTGSDDGDDNESDEDDASDQHGSDDSGKEHDDNGDEEDEDEDEELSEEEEYYSGCDSDEDEEDPILDD